MRRADPGIHVLYLLSAGLEAQRCNSRYEESRCRVRCDREDFYCEDEMRECREEEVCCCDN